jgi:xylan 1,4-beta-xylosidase
MLMRRWILFLFLAAVMPLAAQSTVSVTADLSKVGGPYKPIYSWFGYDEANYTTMPHGRQLLGELHDLTAATVHIRMHHLLTSGDGTPDIKWSSTNVFSIGPDGKPHYDFTILDKIFDALKDAGIQPMVEFGFMPKDLSARTNPYHVAFPRNTTGGSNDPPKDYKEWGELIRVVTAHLVQRYGREETRQWYWEIWNEPNGSYWHASPKDYYELYDYAAAGVKAAFPEGKVGGPATTGPSVAKAATFLDGFLNHCLHDKSAANGGAIPLDFISFHVKGRANVEDGHLSMLLTKEMMDANEGFRIIHGYAKFAKLPIILSEADPEGCAACSSEIPQVAEYRNGAIYPTYTAVAMKGLFELQDRYAVNLISMLSWSFEFENRPIFEGFRALATDGIDKPVLNVFRMAGLMSGDRVSVSSTGAVPLDAIMKTGVKQAPDVDGFATRSARSAALMIWNYSDTNLPGPPSSIDVSLAGLPLHATRVLLEHYRIDDTHSNAYSAWKRMGSPQKPSAEQYEELKQAGQLQTMASPVWVEVKDGKLTLPITLPRQAVSLLRLTW